MSDQIIDCGGVYEVHPLLTSGWAVVNGHSGVVRCECSTEDEAVALATELNEGDVNA